MDDSLIIAGRPFSSRLLMGTGKFSSNNVMQKAIEASGSEVVTVALRRVDLENPDDDLLNAIDTSRYLLLPNTSKLLGWPAWHGQPVANPGSNWRLLPTLTICSPIPSKPLRPPKSW